MFVGWNFKYLRKYLVSYDVTEVPKCFEYTHFSRPLPAGQLGRGRHNVKKFYVRVYVLDTFIKSQYKWSGFQKGQEDKDCYQEDKDGH